MRIPIRAAAAAALVAFSACAPSSNVPLIQSAKVDPKDAFCAPKEARPTSMASILSTVADRIDDPFPRYPEIRRELKAVQGAVGTWDDQRLLEPDLATQFGEPGPYIRVDAMAVPTAPVLASNDTSTPTRRVYVQVQDHGVRRWIGMTAYDTQNVCVEGTRQQ